MHVTNRTIAAAMASVIIALIGGCASSADQVDDEPLTADNIRDRVAAALREAGTFSFNWESTEMGGDETQTWTGDIAYGDDGEVKTLSLTLKGAEEYRLIDDTMYMKSAGGDEWGKSDDKEKSDVLTGWDWAGAVEDGPEITEVSNKGEEEINGVSTTEYQVETKEVTFTWWLDDEDRIVKWKDEESEGILTDYGESVDINAPT